MLEIIFLGTGDAFGKLYYQTNLLLRFGNTNLLIDCGATCSTSLYQLGFPLADIQNVFISHLHADHIGGLEELALQNRYVFRKKLGLYIAANLVEELWDHSLRGGLEYTVEGRAALDYYFDIHPIDHHFTLGNMTFEIVPTFHIRDMPSYGLYFDKIFYSDDTIYNERMIWEMAQRSDLIIHDCTFKENPVHTYFESLANLPEQIRQRMYLIHYNDNSEPMRARATAAGFHCAEKHMCLRFHSESDGSRNIFYGPWKSKKV